jgi:hypothetical protein
MDKCEEHVIDFNNNKSKGFKTKEGAKKYLLESQGQQRGAAKKLVLMQLRSGLEGATMKLTIMQLIWSRVKIS